jgi:hypothetical protein
MRTYISSKSDTEELEEACCCPELCGLIKKLGEKKAMNEAAVT